MKTNKRQRFVIGFVVVFSLLGITFLWMQSNNQAASKFEVTLAELRRLDRTLDRDVLLSRFQILNSYDPLNETSEQIRKLQKTLGQLQGFEENAEHLALAEALRQYDEIVAKKQVLIDDFKSRNSVLKNSLRYLPLLAHELIRLAELVAPDNTLSNDLRSILELILLYNLTSDESYTPEIDLALQAIPAEAFNQVEMTALPLFMSHAQNILKSKPDVDRIIREALALPISSVENAISDSHAAAHLRAEMTARNYLVALYLLCIFLVVLVIWAFLRLRITLRAFSELNANLEQKVIERTQELASAHANLELHFSELRNTQRQLIDASRKAGMADVATSVLHNVGNILNSVNVSASIVCDLLRTSKGSGLSKAISLLQSQPNPAQFLTEDPKGKKLIDYFAVVSKTLEGERSKGQGELVSLSKNVEHIKVIVGMQQSYAKQGGVKEKLSLQGLLQDAIQTNGASHEKHEIKTIKDFQALEEVECDRHKVFQIVMNLLSNAKQAVREQEGERQITVRMKAASGEVRIEVEDNGAGIKAEHLDKIFNHGFTTKKDGHGFGLHSSANAATEMGGRLFAESEGVGKGARFCLCLPLITRKAA